MDNLSHKQNLTVAHLNVRSIFTGFNELCHLVCNLSLGILAVSETRLSEDIPSDVVSIPGYRLFRKDRGRGSGGLGFFVKRELNCRIIELDFVNDSDLEYFWIQIKMQKINIALGVIYRRQTTTSVAKCIEILDNILPQIIANNDKVVLVGDANINQFVIENPLATCLENFGFVQVINEPTRIAQDTATLIDPIFISDSDLVADVGTVNADLISDHKLVYCKMKIAAVKSTQKFVKFRDFKNFNAERFQEDLLNVQWDNIIYTRDIDEKVSILTNNISQLFSFHAPLKTVRVSKPRAPWLTDNLRLIYKERDTALNNYKRNKSDENFNIYKNLRNYALASTRREKAAYINFLQNENSQTGL